MRLTPRKERKNDNFLANAQLLIKRGKLWPISCALLLLLFFATACSDRSFIASPSVKAPGQQGDTGGDDSVGGDDGGDSGGDDSAETNLYHTEGKGGQKGLSQQSCLDGRQFLLRVPQSYSEDMATQLVVAFHGLGDTYENFDATLDYVGWGQLSSSQGFILMTPNHNNSQRASFLHFNSDNSLNHSATRQEALDIIDCIYYSLGQKYNMDTEQIYWLGMSEGAGFISYVGQVHSKSIKALAPYAGIAGHSPGLVQRKIPSYFLSGTEDYSFTAIQNSARDWQLAGHPTTLDFPQGVGHSFVSLNSSTPPQTVWDWMTTVASEPVESAYIRP